MKWTGKADTFKAASWHLRFGGIQWAHFTLGDEEDETVYQVGVKLRDVQMEDRRDCRLPFGVVSKCL